MRMKPIGFIDDTYINLVIVYELGLRFTELLFLYNIINIIIIIKNTILIITFAL